MALSLELALSGFSPHTWPANKEDKMRSQGPHSLVVEYIYIYIYISLISDELKLLQTG